MADRSERTTLVRRHQPLGRIFYHQKIVTGGDLHDGLHVAAHPRVVDRHNGLGAGGDCRLDQAFVHVERIGTDIDEDGDRAAKHEGVCRGDKSVRGHYHLVARLALSQDSGHFKGGRARMGEKGLAAAGLAFQPAVALLGEMPVAREHAAVMCLAYVPEFLAGHEWLVERYFHGMSFLPSLNLW